MQRVVCLNSMTHPTDPDDKTLTLAHNLLDKQDMTSLTLYKKWHVDSLARETISIIVYFR